LCGRDCVGRNERLWDWQECFDSRFVSQFCSVLFAYDVLNPPGTGGVSLFALKLARAAGLKVFLTSSSDRKLQDIRERYPDPPIQTINYSQNHEWHEEVLRLTDGVGVDLVIEVGGASTLLKSLKCTRRGGTVSQVGYLSKAGFEDAEELVPLVIDRRACLR
jgi:NADPH:quinone reductase-like Zn-dependent oxidoreductase